MSAALPAVQQHQLVQWAQKAITAHVEGSAEVRAALMVAESAKGLVIAPGDTARWVDAARTIQVGIKAGDAAKRKVLEVPKAMVAAVNDCYSGTAETLAAALKSINDAQLAEVRRQRAADAAAQRERQAALDAAAAEERRQRETAAAEARRMTELAGAPKEMVELAAQQAADAVDEVVPLVEPPVEVQTQVRGSSGMAVTTKHLKAEIVNLADVDVVLVELRQKDACDVARRQMRLENMPEPGIGRERGVVFQGLRYFYEERIANRGTL